MRIRIKKRVARALVVVIVASVIAAVALVMDVHAATDTGAVQGEYTVRHVAVKKLRTGLYKSGGHWYYGHETASALYNVGDLARDCFRIIDGKYYYFCHDGRMLTRDTHYIKLHKDHSVKYIYTPGTGKKSRFNVDLRRGQTKKHGRWITETGMPYDLYGQIDMQP